MQYVYIYVYIYSKKQALAYTERVSMAETPICVFSTCSHYVSYCEHRLIRLQRLRSPTIFVPVDIISRVLSDIKVIQNLLLDMYNFGNSI